MIFIDRSIGSTEAKEQNNLELLIGRLGNFDAVRWIGSTSPFNPYILDAI